MPRLLKLFIACYGISFFLWIFYLFSPKLTDYKDNFASVKTDTINTTVEIWSKASIGDYLWIHILNAREPTGVFRKIATHTFGELNFIYRSGPGYIQTTVPQNVIYLVIVINGRTQHDVKKSMLWLDYLPHLVMLKRTAVVLLGNERCENDWVKAYMRSNGGLIDILFIVYDSILVNNYDVYQWPLGVATYRNFPFIEEWSIHAAKNRTYKCNFMGTIYKNSSREVMINILEKNKEKQCYVATRYNWLPSETKHSIESYKSVLMNSDLTLSPVGKNTECYRVFEALAYGSVPIIEDVMTPGSCSSPLRLLKRYGAPVIFIKKWEDLDMILTLDQKLNFFDIIKRRHKLISWYKQFRKTMAHLFFDLIKDKFFLM